MCPGGTSTLSASFEWLQTEWTHMKDGVPVSDTQMGTSWGSTRPDVNCCTWDGAIPVWCELQRHFHSSGSQQCPGWRQKKCDQQAEGNDPPPLHCSFRNPLGVLYSRIQKMHWPSGVDLKEVDKNYQRDGISVIWWNIWKKPFTMMVLKHWNRLPREVVVYLETFKIRLNEVLGNLIYLKMYSLITEGIGQDNIQSLLPTQICVWLYPLLFKHELFLKWNRAERNHMTAFSFPEKLNYMSMWQELFNWSK